MRRIFSGAVALLMPVVFAGCAVEEPVNGDDMDALGEDIAQDENAAADEEEGAEVASSTEALATSGPEYSWSQGQPVVLMGGTDGRVCFLTRVTGKFYGGGEAVYVFASGGSWYLGGQSQQSGVGAGARCVSVASYSGEYSWSQGQYPVYMGSASNRACFLTRVTGKFKGGGEVVHAYTSWDAWYLGGQSQQSAVGASARCVDMAPSGEYGWGQGQLPVYMGSSANLACFLTRMTGKFEGGGEVVRAYTSGDWWYLGGQSQQSAVGASARCL